MKVYDISGKAVKISTAFENYRNYMKEMQPYLDGINSAFNKWYGEQGDCKSVYNNDTQLLDRILTPIVDKAVDILNREGIYSVSSNMLINDYLYECFEPYDMALDEMMDKLNQITQTQNRETAYRKVRKATRGKVVGGGFGLSGAIKGMATAGAINAATGAAHSMANIMGNMGSAIAASSNKSALFSDSKAPLREAFKSCIEECVFTLMLIIEKYTDISYEYVTQKDIDESNAIYQNYISQKIPAPKRLEQIAFALQLNPFDLKLYKTIWKDFGDDSGDLREMAKYFEIPLDAYINELTEKICKQIYEANCKDYINARNPIVAAVDYEKEIQKALRLMLDYCDKRKISRDVSTINLCNQILITADRELCTVYGVRYSNRAVAKKILDDRKKFYDFIAKNDLYSEEIQDRIKELDFSSDYYQNNIKKILEQEINLRDPLKLYSNIKAIVGKYFTEQKTSLGSIEVWSLDSSFEKKIELITSITSLHQSEQPILLVNFASKGKTGILVTNFFLRVYSRGFFGTKSTGTNLEKISKIICCGENEYKTIREKEVFDYSIKGGLTIEEQNKLGKLLEETVFIVNNLSEQNRKNLKSINEKSMRCECGTYIPDYINYCPKCFKIPTEEGKFVDTIQCNNCGRRIAQNKKFCSYCGARLGKQNISEQLNQLDIGNSVDNINSVIIKQEFCSNCGNWLKPGGKFCSKCGQLIDREHIQTQCPGCGNLIIGKKKFCSKCGKALIWEV